MSEQQKQDSCDVATMLKDLPKEDRLQIQGVIAGMRLARKGAAKAAQRELSGHSARTGA